MRRARKQARKTAIREGLIAAPKPKPASAVPVVGHGPVGSGPGRRSGRLG